jgi:hypothetical protein
VEAWPGESKKVVGAGAALEKEVFGLLLDKHETLERARRELGHKALLDLWLYALVPLAFALLAALAAHIVAVFIYW